ncbi:MAG: hypothetical protein HY359_07545 [Candidatus Rokubacteria bacterium]|nr:hypothetical protein [Candidatus Rokubacteria bacterium]
MQDLFIIGLVGVTSVAAYLIGARGLRLPRRGLGPAAGRTLECVGLTLLFFGANLAVGVAAVLAARAVTRGFVSLYLADDVVLLPLSLLQALLFAWWRAASGR